MFCIETKKLKLKLEIVPVSSLFIHEEVIVQSARKLILEFKNMAGGGCLEPVAGGCVKGDEVHL